MLLGEDLQSQNHRGVHGVKIREFRITFLSRGQDFLLFLTVIVQNLRNMCRSPWILRILLINSNRKLPETPKYRPGVTH